MTKSGRQRVAYEHYVNKYSHNRVKRMKKYKVVKSKAPPSLPASQEMINASVNDAPQSVTAGDGN